MASIGFKKIKSNIRNYISLGKVLKKDKRVPRISIVFLSIAIFYFFLPIDLIPDFIPILGQLDDLVIITFLIFLAVKFIPKEVYKENYDNIFK